MPRAIPDEDAKILAIKAHFRERRYSYCEVYTYAEGDRPELWNVQVTSRNNAQDTSGSYCNTFEGTYFEAWRRAHNWLNSQPHYLNRCARCGMNNGAIGLPGVIYSGDIPNPPQEPVIQWALVTACGYCHIYRTHSAAREAFAEYIGIAPPGRIPCGDCETGGRRMSLDSFNGTGLPGIYLPLQIITDYGPSSAAIRRAECCNTCMAYPDNRSAQEALAAHWGIQWPQ